MPDLPNAQVGLDRIEEGEEDDDGLDAGDKNSSVSRIARVALATAMVILTE